MANITLPDGTVLPEYALETTQQEVMKLLMAQVSANKKEFALYEKLVKNSAEQLKNDEKNEDLIEEQVEALKGIRQDAKTGKSILGKNMVDLGDAANKTADFIIKMGVGAAGVALSGLALFGKNAMNLGNTLADLGQVGIGLDGVGDSTAGTIASLNALGLTTTQAAEQMVGAAGTIAAIGQRQFVNVNAAIADMTASGGKFGLTMNELAGVAADDLATRQKLGILDNLNANTAAARSAELYQSQMDAAKLLGKSIGDIRGASRNTLEENAQFALRVQSIGAKLGPEVARGFTLSMEKGLSALAGSGLSQNLIDGIGNEIGAAVAFAGESGQELFRTLNYINPELTQSVRNMNAMAKSNDPKVVAKVGDEMQKFQETLLNTAADMSDKDFDALNQQLLAGSMGQAGIEFAQSIGELRIAAQKYGKTTAAEMNALAQGAKAYDNAMSKFRGGISGLFNDMSGALGPALAGFASAFTTTMSALPEGAKDARTYISESGEMIREYTDASGKLIKENVTDQMGITDVFKSVMQDVSKTITSMFGDAEGGFTNLGDMLRQKVVPVIIQFGQWFKDGGAQKILEAFKTLGRVLSGVTKPFLAIAKLFTGDFKGAGETLFSSFNSLAGIIGTTIATFVIANKAVKAFGAGKSMMANLGFGGGGKSAVATASGTSGGGAGKGIGDIGKGIGKGIGGIFKGLAGGLAAFANPAVAIGAAVFAGAVVTIGAAVAGATWMMGKALPTFAEGLDAFNGIDGKNLIAVGAGLAALGIGMASVAVGGVMNAIGSLFGGGIDFEMVKDLQKFSQYKIDEAAVKRNAGAIVAYSGAMAALGAGSAIGGLGNLVGAVADGIAGFFGKKPPIKQMEEFARLNIDHERVKNNAEAVSAYASAMATLAMSQAAGGIGSILNIVGGIADGIAGFFGKKPPLEQMQDFAKMNIDGDRVKTNAEAVASFAEAMGKLAMSQAAGGLGALGNLASSLFDGITGFFGGERSDALPVDKMNEFGAMQLNVEGIVKNAEGVSAFAAAIGGMGDVDWDDIEEAGDLFNDGLIEKLNKINGLTISESLMTDGISTAALNLGSLAEAYAKFAEIDADDLDAAADSIIKVNQGLSQGAGGGTNILDMLMNSVFGPATESPAPPTPSAEPLQSAFEGTQAMNTESSSSPTESSGMDGTGMLAELLKKNNQKLDQLISLNTKQL